MTDPGLICGLDNTLVPDHENHRIDKKNRYRKPRVKLSKRLRLSPTAVPGISLTNYSLNAQQKGWGAPCTQARTTITLSNGVRVTVATAIARLSQLVLNECIRRGYVIRQADTGAYNCRYISGTTVWSNHAWGLAIDVNWQTNPFTASTVTDKPGWLFALFNRYGFANGADYTGKHDWMHHEFMGTPAQAAAATALAERELGAGGVVPVDGDPAGVDQFDDVLMVGDRGVAVKVLQRVLNAWYGLGLVVDGIFGPGTETGVKRAQTGGGLGADGQAGPATLSLLGMQPVAAYPFVKGAIRQHYYYDRPDLEEILGDPITNELPTVDGFGRYNNFERGVILYHPAIGARELHGAILDKFNAVGGVKTMSYPTTDENKTPDGVGRYNHFYGDRSIYWSPTTGAHTVWGAIRKEWAARGWETGIGYPTSDEYQTPEGKIAQDFQRGKLVFDPVTATVSLVE